MKKPTTNTLKLRELYHLQPETGFGVLPHHQSGAGENGHQKVEKQVTDFFLKIENAENGIDINDIVSKINNIDGITMVYAVDKNKIKSKNNLIF